MLESTAVFSACRRYRYSLTRIWNRDRPTVLFIGLNPSTADATRNDPTIRRCMGFAKDWGYGGLVVVNLFAYRATQPRQLKQAADPIGPRNDAAIQRANWATQMIVAAWGIHGSLFNRDRNVLMDLNRPFCLGLTRDGAPRHPLYVSKVTRLTPYAVKASRFM
jgi:hypothetical protein